MQKEEQSTVINRSGWLPDGSIYTDVLRQEGNLLDIAENEVSDELAFWVEQVLQRGQGGMVRISPRQPERWWHLFHQIRQNYRLGMPVTARLGFPLVIIRGEGVSWSGPLFFWEVVLEPANPAGSEWLVQRQPNQLIEANPWMDYLLREHLGFDLSARWPLTGRPGTIDLERTLHDLADDWPSSWQIAHWPTPAVWGQQTTGHKLFPAAVLGDYPDIPGEWLKMQQGPGIQWSESVIEPQSGHPFGMLPLDPWQASAVQAFQQQTISIVEGGAGAGKLTVLQHLLSNSLSNGRRCIIIAEQLPLLQRVWRELERSGLASYAFLWRDPAVDFSLLLDLLRAQLGTEREEPPFAAETFQRQLAQCARLRNKLDQAYSAVHGKVFGDRNWPAAVGAFLAAERHADKSLLGGQLQSSDFALDAQEFASLQEIARKMQPLFAAVQALNHPLDEIRAALFSQGEEQESRQWLTEQLVSFQDRLSHLQRRFVTSSSRYGDQLRAHLNDCYKRLQGRHDLLLERLQDYRRQYGDDFFLTSQTSLKIYGTLTRRGKAIRAAREDIAQRWQELAADWATTPYFDFQFYPDNRSLSMVRLDRLRSEFATELAQWHAGLEAYVQEETLRLSASNQHSGLPEQEELSLLENDMEALLAAFNGAGILEKPVEHHLLTFSKRQKFLEQLIAQLGYLEANMRDFSPYFQWRSAWLALDDRGRLVTKALAITKPPDWEASLCSWYLHQVLLREQQATLPEAPQPLSEYRAEWEVLAAMLPQQIAHTWHTRRRGIARDLRRENRQLHQLVFGKRETNMGENGNGPVWGRDAITLGSGAFPIMLFTARAARQLLRDLPPGSFDQLFWLDAQESAPTFFPMFSALAQRAMLLGDPHLITQKGSPSLLQAARERYPATLLAGIHRYYLGNPWQLWRGGFISEAAVQPMEMAFVTLPGQWNAAEGVNEIEAQAILNTLLEVQPTPQRTFPSIGVVCWHEGQRNYLATALYRMRRSQDATGELIQQLERNGLAILLLDETTGQHFDWVLFSPGFSTSGSLLQGTVGAAAQSGQSRRQLHLLAGLPTRKLSIFSSMPLAALRELGARDDLNDAALWATYLLLVDALANGDEDQATAAYQEILRWQPGAHPAGDPIFWDEVALRLRPYLGTDRVVRNFKEAQLHLPLVLEANKPGGTRHALCVDGFWAQTPATDYTWECRRREQLREHHIATAYLWSILWWKDSMQEARRLSGQLIRQEQQEQT